VSTLIPPTFFESIALPLAHRGWEVAPCYPNDKQVHTKLVPSPLTMKSKDPAQIRAWGAAEPFANVCVYAEQKSGGLLFLDKDGAVSLRAKYEAETGKQFPKTLLVRSSVISDGNGGTITKGHWYFLQSPRTIALNGNIPEAKTGGLFSLRIHNQYVASIGSIHPGTGLPYAIAEDHPVQTMPDDLLDWLLKQIVEEKKPAVSAVGERRLVKHGQMHGAYVAEAGRLWNRGYESDDVVEMTTRWMVANGEAPVDEDKVRKEALKVTQLYKRGEATESAALVLNQTAAASVADVSNWREQFRSVGEMDDGPIVEVIHGVLQEGICFLGASPSDGKTLVSLALAKAICTGEPLFGLSQFSVTEPRTVIYLIPESRDRAFRKRCEAFRIPNDKTKFMARTVSLGPTLQLEDPILLQAVKETKGVVFLDTAVRFMKGADENSAAQNRLLVNDVINLLANGAVCVVLAHHATKASPNEPMTMENMLRGTSDFAAMCDQIYGIRKDRNLYDNGDGPMELDLVNLKDREQIGELTKIRLAASSRQSKSEAPTSVINSTGNFRVVDKEMNRQRSIQDLLTIVKMDVLITLKELARKTAMSEYEVESQLRSAGWHRVKGGKEGASPWHQDSGLECPYGKPISMSKVLPIDRPKKPTMKDAILLLKDVLAGTSESQTVSVERVLEEAGRKGLTDTQVKDARKELGVKKGEDGGLYLPLTNAAGKSGEPEETNQLPISEAL
jgi:hypothetical protein